MSATPQRNIQIKRNGAVMGGFPLQEMRALISSGMILPTDHYLYEGMKDWQEVGETWAAERLRQPAKEPTDALAETSAVKEYIVWYDDRPAAPWKISSHSALNVAKDFALQCPHDAQDFVVCVRDTRKLDEIQKFKCRTGVWSRSETPNSLKEQRDASKSQPSATLDQLLANPPNSVDIARMAILVNLWFVTLLGMFRVMPLFVVDINSTHGAALVQQEPIVSAGMLFCMAVYGKFVAGMIVLMTNVFFVGMIYLILACLKKGKNWARILFVILSLISILGVLMPMNYSNQIAILQLLTGFGCSIVVLVQLTRKETAAWCRRVTLLRDEKLCAAS